MATMKYPNVSGPTSNNMAAASTVDEVDSLFNSSCWQNSGLNLHSDFMDAHSLSLDSSMSQLGSDKLLLGSPISHDENGTDGGGDMESDSLDKLFTQPQPPPGSTPNNLAELKPLPPFTGYTANLSINGIQGHHFHTISQRHSEDHNNNHHHHHHHHHHPHNHQPAHYSNAPYSDIVSSSTCNAHISDSSAGWADCTNPDSSAKLITTPHYTTNHHLQNASVQPTIKSECVEYDMSLDFANIIGSAMADTTVPTVSDDHSSSRDSWMDLDALIDHACSDPNQKLIHLPPDPPQPPGIPPSAPDPSSYTMQHQPPSASHPTSPTNPTSSSSNATSQQASTLQTLLTHGYMPLLQNRLQNGPPTLTHIKTQPPSPPCYVTTPSDLISTSSPPANVGSTTDTLILACNGGQARFLATSATYDDYPHTTTTTHNIGHSSLSTTNHVIVSNTGGGGGTGLSKKSSGSSRSRSHKNKAAAAAAAAAAHSVFGADPQSAAAVAAAAAAASLGLLGKEKPVHRCSICNRGFLNKSNIKVHLRTHTGEKPFRCETCAKAFRQKAHLLKHQQIHKRIGRD